MADNTILVALDWFSKQFVAVNATPQNSGLARCPRHSLDVEVDSNAAGPVNSNTSTITTDTICHQSDTGLHC